MSENKKEELYFFPWIIADMVGKKLKKKLRRRGWPEGRWIRYQDGLWLIERGSPTTWEVVRSTDFGEEEFFATDWTHLPPSCLPPEEHGQGGCDKPLMYEDFLAPDFLDDLEEKPQNDSGETQDSQFNSSGETQDSQPNDVIGALWLVGGGGGSTPRPPRPQPPTPPFPNLTLSLQYFGLPSGPCANGNQATLPGNHTVQVVASVSLEDGAFPGWRSPFLVQVYFRGRYWFSTFISPGGNYAETMYSVFTPHSCNPWARVAYNGHAVLYGYPVVGLGGKVLSVVSQEIEIPSYCTRL